MREQIYVGGYSNCINICAFEEGRIVSINKINGIKNPSYLNINGDFLYTVEEQKNGKIVAYKMGENDFKLISIIDINASLPCYITTDRRRENLLVANYESGSMLLFGLNKDGSIGNEKGRKLYSPRSHIHFAEFIKEKIYVVDLGDNSVYIYNLQMHLLDTIRLEEGLGPRHLVANNDGNIIYIVTEYSNQILMYVKENQHFVLKQSISTLGNQLDKSYAAAIKITINNKNIYVTNRGENTISVFENINNKLKLIQTVSSYGDYPRDFILNKDEQFAIVANQKSNNLVIFKRDKNSGKLAIYKDEKLIIESPSCIVRRKYEL